VSRIVCWFCGKRVSLLWWLVNFGLPTCQACETTSREPRNLRWRKANAERERREAEERGARG